MKLVTSSNSTLMLLTKATAAGHRTLTQSWLPWLPSSTMSNRRTVAETPSRPKSQRNLALERKPTGQGLSCGSSSRVGSTGLSPVPSTPVAPTRTIRMNPANSLTCTTHRSPTTILTESKRWWIWIASASTYSCLNYQMYTP